MQLKLTRNQLVDLMFALELAEDNAPGMRKWSDLRLELRLQLAVYDAGVIRAGKDGEEDQKCEMDANGE